MNELDQQGDRGNDVGDIKAEVKGQNGRIT
jgi:hypothetical protein